MPKLIVNYSHSLKFFIPQKLDKNQR